MGKIIESGGISCGWIRWAVKNYPYEMRDIRLNTRYHKVAPLTIAIGILYLWTKAGGKNINMIALSSNASFAELLHDLVIELSKGVKAPDDALCSVSGLTEASKGRGNYQYHVNVTIAYIPEWIKFIKNGNRQFSQQTMFQRTGAAKFQFIFVTEVIKIIKNEKEMLNALYKQWNINDFKGILWASSGMDECNSDEEYEILIEAVQKEIVRKFIPNDE